jgi:hypothetical protein
MLMPPCLERIETPLYSAVDYLLTPHRPDLDTTIEPLADILRGFGAATAADGGERPTVYTERSQRGDTMVH